MFGYVVLNKPEIKFKDFEHFKLEVNKLLQDKIREIRYKE